MCGITGFLTADSQDKPAKLATLRRMTDSLAHRGPDAGGVFQSANGNANLGHRRLAIIDLSPTGAQPMQTTDNRYAISYNGEIYNFRELGKELVAEGTHFRGSSDTEVLLAGLARWGVANTLLKLNGMFALALWDNAEERLYLARDRFGEKPLYYSFERGVLLFGSELKALAQHPAFRRDIDDDALEDFLRFNCVPAPQCIFRGTQQLRPGEFLVARPGRMPEAPQPYWSPRSLVEPHRSLPGKADDPALVDALEQHLRVAVQRRMVADVPLGAFLSGGIDSSVIVALMQACASGPVKTFTMGFGEAAYDESKDAARVARHLGTDHHEMIVSTGDCLDVIARLPEIYDEPFADASQIPTALVAAFTRKHVTVALSGDAGDELFGGYNRYFWGARLWPQLQRFPAPARRLGAGLIRSVTPAGWNGFFRAIDAVTPARYRVRGPGEKLHKLAGVLDASDANDFFLRLLSQWQDPARILRTAGSPGRIPAMSGEAPAGLDFVQQMMFRDLTGYLPADILCKVDRATMAVALESRVPFLDNDLVDFAWTMPLDAKLREGQGKWLLRQVLKRHVPEALFDRPKTGFGVPIGPWLRGPLRGWAEDLLAPASLGASGRFDVNAVRRVWAEHLSGRTNRQYQLWCVLMFESWRRHWRIS